VRSTHKCSAFYWWALELKEPMTGRPLVTLPTLTRRWHVIVIQTV
jgi:hypothetical protein